VAVVGFLARDQIDLGAIVEAVSPAPEVARPPGWPAPSTDEASAPLGTPPPVAVANPAYAFIATQPDGISPVAYDPCRPIHYVVRTQGEPTGAGELVTQAVAEVSRATGLVFTYDGTTTEAPATQRPLTSPDLYGDRWAPVLITWETADENPDLAVDVLGEAGSVAVTRPGDDFSVFVTGQVRLDSTQFADLLTTADGATTARIALIHELGHLVGLSHVNDPTQVMFPAIQVGLIGYAPGDLTGLAQLGQGQCAPDL